MPSKEVEESVVPTVAEVKDDDDMSSLSPVSSRAADETLENLHTTEGKSSPSQVASVEPKVAEPEVAEPEVEAETTPEVPEDAEMVDAGADTGAAADDEAGEEDDKKPAQQPGLSHYPKRKRTSTYREVEEFDDADETTVQGEEPPVELEVPVEPPTKRHGANGIKGVIVGHWRDSNAPTKSQKHAVIAFIDIRDRLRTRIQPTNMKGEPIDLNLYPIPPGPGGSWTTFGGIVFENQLVGLEQFHIKEFVKIRSDAEPNETPEQKFVADKRAVKEAIRRVAANPPPDTPANAVPAIAYGDDIPYSVRELDDQKRKKRRLGSGAAALVQQHNVAPGASVRTPPSERAIQPAPVVQSPADIQMAPAPAADPTLPTDTLNNLPGVRPTKILVGTWSHSSEPKKEDRHAVYGILGINDMFRVKVVRETQSGNFVDGNFPQGAGALWITYDQVELDEHLASLERAEVKEYVRYRQYQIDHQGETDKDKDENILIAVQQAKMRWAHYDRKTEALNEEDQDHHLNGGGPAFNYGGSQQFPSTPETRNGLRSSFRETRQSISASGGPPTGPTAGAAQAIAPAPTMEPRPETTPPIKLDGRTKAGRLAKAQFAAVQAARRDAENAAAVAHMGGRPIEPRPATRSRRSSADALERTHSLAQREVARAEANSKRDERHEANREMRITPGAGGPGGPAPIMVAAARGLAMDPNMERLDKVWQRQEATRINKYQAEDAIFHAGVKYQRRDTGPFKNQLASHGSILNIDGEDYVEYRVLLKPTFF
ncbi:hypothetical protein MKZ38_001114 [Zalerion maritima]|uniref:Uncharacterized protein n=1 Tax=Zalerion maritima TaxID=339359 RepID=A0AAD5RQM2_9PEZI|nr:hypothetical protein MKZ38_001114 [Zalerion maritima]